MVLHCDQLQHPGLIKASDQNISNRVVRITTYWLMHAGFS